MILKHIAQVNTMRKQYEQYLPLSKDEGLNLSNKFKIEETYTSNHIEGNPFSFEDSCLIIKHGTTFNSMDINTFHQAKAISNLYNAINMSHAFNARINEAFICNLHYLTMQFIIDNDELGKYKAKRNWIGHINTSTPQATSKHMLLLVEWLNKALNSDKHILDIASEFKYRFLVIHPFSDGNGRLSRLLYNHIIRSKGYIDSSILPEDKNAYYKALKNCSIKNNICRNEALSEFMCMSLCKTYNRRIEEIG